MLNDLSPISALSVAEKYIGLKLPNNLFAEETDIDGYKIVTADNSVTIQYSKKHYFFKAVADVCAGASSGEGKLPFEHFGVMLDCARNGVPAIEELKAFIVRLAFSGYGYLGLYLEDCFEVDGEPYFGYMRGRYSKSELSEIVEFASVFGIEIVPYIQTLAHLYGIFHHWEHYTATVRDFGDILLIGEKRTYELIENMLRTVSEVFSSKRINLGMDEAFMMLLGKYRDINGIADRAAAFSYHVERVCALCRKYGLSPSVWADMFLSHVSSEKLKIPNDLTLVAWSYACKEEQDYEKQLNAAAKLTDKIYFASAAHKWYGYAPLNEFTDFTALPALKAAKGRVKDFCLTLWGDDGAECSYNAVWYSLLNVASKAYGQAQMNSEVITGYSPKELLCMDLPNKVFDEPMDKEVNVSKYALFEDVFYGLSDRRSSERFTEYFERNEKILNSLAAKKGPFRYLYSEYAALCGVLKLKTGLRQKLIAAYKSGDKVALSGYADTLGKILKKLTALKKLIETQWLKDYKPFGIEVQQIRLAGLSERLKFCRNKLNDYAVGKISKIAELEEDDLAPVLSGDNYTDALRFNSYEQNVSYGMISHKLFN